MNGIKIPHKAACILAISTTRLSTRSLGKIMSENASRRISIETNMRLYAIRDFHLLILRTNEILFVSFTPSDVRTSLLSSVFSSTTSFPSFCVFPCFITYLHITTASAAQIMAKRLRQYGVGIML